MKTIIKFIIEEVGKTVIIVPTNGGQDTLHISLTKQSVPHVTTGVFKVADLELEALKVFIPDGIRALTTQILLVHNSVRVDVFTTTEKRLIFTLPYTL